MVFGVFSHVENVLGFLYAEAEWSMGKSNATHELTSFSPWNFIFASLVRNLTILAWECLMGSFVEHIGLLYPFGNKRQKRFCRWQLTKDQLKTTKVNLKTQSKTQSKSDRDKPASHQEFQPGDQVSVQLPLQGHPYHTKFNGAYQAFKNVISANVSTDRHHPPCPSYIDTKNLYNTRPPVDDPVSDGAVCIFADGVEQEQEDITETSPLTLSTDRAWPSISAGVVCPHLVKEASHVAFLSARDKDKELLDSEDFAWSHFCCRAGRRCGLFAFKQVILLRDPLPTLLAWHHSKNDDKLLGWCHPLCSLRLWRCHIRRQLF